MQKKGDNAHDAITKLKISRELLLQDFQQEVSEKNAQLKAEIQQLNTEIQNLDLPADTQKKLQEIFVLFNRFVELINNSLNQKISCSIQNFQKQINAQIKEFHQRVDKIVAEVEGNNSVVTTPGSEQPSKEESKGPLTTSIIEERKTDDPKDLKISK